MPRGLGSGFGQFHPIATLDQIPVNPCIRQLKKPWNHHQIPVNNPSHIPWNATQIPLNPISNTNAHEIPYEFSVTATQSRAPTGSRYAIFNYMTDMTGWFSRPNVGNYSRHGAYWWSVFMGFEIKNAGYMDRMDGKKPWWIYGWD